jgi:hypothetical protein
VLPVIQSQVLSLIITLSRIALEIIFKRYASAFRQVHL